MSRLAYTRKWTWYRRRAYFTSFDTAYPFIDAVSRRTNGKLFCRPLPAGGYIVMW